jgi:hypothetical protein
MVLKNIVSVLGEEAALGAQFIFLILLLPKDTKAWRSNSDSEVSQPLLSHSFQCTVLPRLMLSYDGLACSGLDCSAESTSISESR